MIWYFLLKLIPRRARTAGRFTAPDPWNGNRPTEFSIEAYKMVPKMTHTAPNPEPSERDRFGIRSEIDGVERMLPESLSELWKTERIRAESLPKLLAAIQPRLRKHDYPLLLHQHSTSVIRAVYGCASVLLLIIASNSLVDAIRAAPHRLVSMLNTEWQERPQVEDQYVKTEGTTKIEEVTDVRFTPRSRPNLWSNPVGRWQLAQVRAQHGRRLLLIEDQWARSEVHAGNSTVVRGVTVRPASIGFPAQLLADLRQRVPDLDTDFVTGQSWMWTDSGTPSWPGAFFAVLALLVALPVLLITTRQARRRRQMKWLLQQA